MLTAKDTTDQPLWQEHCFPKHCRCGASYTEHGWSRLPYYGMLSGISHSNGRRFYADLEIRRCLCGTGLAVKMNRRLRLTPDHEIRRKR